MIKFIDRFLDRKISTLGRDSPIVTFTSAVWYPDPLHSWKWPRFSKFLGDRVLRAFLLSTYKCRVGSTRLEVRASSALKIWKLGRGTPKKIVGLKRGPDSPLDPRLVRREGHTSSESKFLTYGTGPMGIAQMRAARSIFGSPIYTQ